MVMGRNDQWPWFAPIIFGLRTAEAFHGQVWKPLPRPRCQARKLISYFSLNSDTWIYICDVVAWTECNNRHKYLLSQQPAKFWIYGHVWQANRYESHGHEFRLFYRFAWNKTYLGPVIIYQLWGGGDGQFFGKPVISSATPPPPPPPPNFYFAVYSPNNRRFVILPSHWHLPIAKPTNYYTRNSKWLSKCY